MGACRLKCCILWLLVSNVLWSTVADSLEAPVADSLVQAVGLIEQGCAELRGFGAADVAAFLERAGQARSIAVTEAMFLACQSLYNEASYAVAEKHDVWRSLPQYTTMFGLARRLSFEEYLGPTMGFLPPLAVCAALYFIFVVLFETLFLKSTIGSSRVMKVVGELENEWKKDTEWVNNKFHDFGRMIIEASESAEKIEDVNKAATEQHPDLFQCDVDQFWKAMHGIANTEAQIGATAPESEDVIAFTRRTYAAREEDRIARISLTRLGACQGTAEVKVVTAESRTKTEFSARGGRDFRHVESTVFFEDGEREKELEIGLLPSSSDGWQPSRWFTVKLTGVVKGTAKLGGPTVEKNWSGATYVPTARVYILQRNIFPANLPKELEGDWRWLVFYYIKDRVRNRKEKYWKTLCGLLYEPIHNVAVMFLIQKLLLDWATKPEKGGSYLAVFGLVIVQLLSTALYRWGDVVQTKCRGRTGGVRMLHRQQILAKMMMVDHEEHFKVPGYHWFYAAISDVDKMTKDGYWEVFMLLESVFGLFLCLLTLVADTIYSTAWGAGKFTWESYLPAFGVLFMVPITSVLIFRRRSQTMTLIRKRLDGEEAWIETFAWLAHAGGSLYAMGAPELDHVEQMYSAQSKFFVKCHQVARDFTHDTNWISVWVTTTFYLLFMCWGGFRLIQQMEEGREDFQVGGYVLLMEVYLKFGEYLLRVNEGIVEIQKSAVSIKRVADLLNLQELRSFTSSPMSGTASDRPECGKNVIEVREVDLTTLSLSQGPFKCGPMGPLRMRSGSSVEIPLGRLVVVTGGTEGALMTFLALLSRVVQPNGGIIACPPAGTMAWPPSEKGRMMPPVPVVSPPHFKVLSALQLAGAPDEVAFNLAAVLGLEPSRSVDSLALGEAQMLSLGRSILSDPDVFFAVRPMGPLSPQQRKRMGHLLRAWQSGGVQVLLDHLVPDRSGNGVVVAGSNGQEFGTASSRRRRTLIMTGDHPFGDARADVRIDINDVLIEGRDFGNMPEAEKEVRVHLPSQGSFTENEPSDVFSISRPESPSRQRVSLCHPEDDSVII